MNFSTRDYIEQTALSPVAAGILKETEQWLPFLADLVQKDILFFVPSADQTELIVTVKAASRSGAGSSFGHVGQRLARVREQVLGRVLECGRPISGRRELEPGSMIAFDAYPLYDNAGLVTAAVAFTGAVTGTPQELLDAAWRLLGLPYPETEIEMTVTPQDGILLYRYGERLIYSNEVGHKLIQWEGAADGAGVSRGVKTGPVALARAEKTVAAAEWKAGENVFFGRALPVLSGGNVLAVLLLLTDVTLLREKEKELLVKDAVIKEIHHRVKNNLQTVAGLLRMQARRSEAATKAALHEAELRILAIAKIHDTLASQLDDRVSLQLLLDDLLGQMRQEWTPAVDFEFMVAKGCGCVSSDQAVALGMIVHELVQNACEHGLPDTDGRRSVSIRILYKEKQLTVCVSNLGTLDKECFSEADYHLGLRIVKSLVETNLNGIFTIRGDASEIRAECQIPWEENHE